MSNGVLVTNLPARFANAGSYNFEGYVNFTPPGGFAFTNAVTVDLGPLTVCVFSFTNNCAPGSVSLTNTNTSANTNFSLCAGGRLGVATNATNALITLTTNCPCDASLNGTVTSNLPPTILSNWWTVRGPGNYTNSGSGLSSLLSPTNGGTGTNTFYVSYTTWTNTTNSAPQCCTNTNSLQVPFNVLQMTVTNLAFGGGLHTVCQDANAEPYPANQWTTNTNYPVCYTAGTPMTATATFSVTPSTFPLPVLVKGVSSGPLLPVTPTSISGPSLALTVTSTNNFHSNVDFLNPMIIDWKYSCDNGTNWCDAGTSTNPVYVTLADPLAGTTLFRTVLNFACTNRGATDSNTAVANTWSLFGGSGPKNITTWDNKPLYYYKTNCGWATDTKTTQDLLASANTTYAWAGHGECGAFANLFRDSLAANGISSDFTTASSTNGDNFIINDWITNRAATYPQLSPYIYALVLVTEADLSTGMVPAPSNNAYGDLTKLNTKTGQNTAPPSEEAFLFHYIVKYPHGGTSGVGTYYDPSYGVQYTDATNFETVAVWGYYRHVSGLNYKVRPASGLHNMHFDR
jgi:hypothetical protein